MFYKVIYNGRVIDVLDDLLYLKYQEKYDRMVFCSESEAQAILSSDQKHIWHVEGMYDVPVDRYDVVVLEEIDEYEYRQLKVLNMKTPEAIIDEFVLTLFESEII